MVSGRPCRGERFSPEEIEEGVVDLPPLHAAAHEKAFDVPSAQIQNRESDDAVIAIAIAHRQNQSAAVALAPEECFKIGARQAARDVVQLVRPLGKFEDALDIFGRQIRDGEFDPA